MFDPVTLRVPDLATARTALAVVLNELDIQETRSTLSFSVWGTSLSRRPTTTIPSHGASISRSSPPPQPMSTASAEPAPVPLRLDITNTDQVAEAARQAQDVDLLINNADRVAPGELTGEAIVDVARREMEVNYFGPPRMLQRFADTLAQHGGAIVNVNSGAGLANAPILPTYSASKAALHSLTQASRALLAARGVAVFWRLPRAGRHRPDQGLRPRHNATAGRRERHPRRRRGGQRRHLPRPLGPRLRRAVQLLAQGRGAPGGGNARVAQTGGSAPFEQSASV